MAERKQKELGFLGGELAAWLLSVLPVAFAAPKVWPNPFAEQPPMSDAMKAHIEGWNRDKWKAMTKGE